MIYPNKPLYLLSLLGYIYYLTYYTLTTKDNIVYSLFFVLGELSWFSTPFSVFYNKGVGLPAFAFLTSSQPAGFSTPFNISSLK